MVEALERHLGLLKEYSVKAFEEGKVNYGGEIAGKLRLLVTESPSKRNRHRPLLLGLMAVTGIEPLITLDGPPVQPLPGEPGPGDKITLRQYVQLRAVGIRVTPELFVVLNKDKLIRLWAQQTGSAHEDWELEPELDAILKAEIFIGGLHAALAELRGITKTVLHIADRFLSEYRARGTAGDGVC